MKRRGGVDLHIYSRGLFRDGENAEEVRREGMEGDERPDSLR